MAASSNVATEGEPIIIEVPGGIGVINSPDTGWLVLSSAHVDSAGC